MIDDFINKSVKDILQFQLEIEALSTEKRKIDSSLSDKRSSVEKIREDLLGHMIENNLKIYENKDSEITIKSTPKSYNIKNDIYLFEYLKSIKEYDRCCSSEIKVDKRELNKVFSDMNSCDGLPSCVEVVPGVESIQIKFSSTKSDKPDNKPKLKVKNNEKIASRVNDDSDIDINEFDSL